MFTSTKMFSFFSLCIPIFELNFDTQSHTIGMCIISSS
uniref:Uncharacterized protein n=1 Tax=Arundo donax TaxID=35708 RepID=A0A0A9HIN3_ARUDO